MAGYGNRTAPDYTADNLADEHSNTRLGLTDSHSPPTYGAGFGNKRASDTPAVEESAATRFNTQDRVGSAPYSDAHTYGSASTAGAGWGNKTGSFSSGGDGAGKGDSVVGKVMERVGGVVHSGGLVEKGRAKREGAGADVAR